MTSRPRRSTDKTQARLPNRRIEGKCSGAQSLKGLRSFPPYRGGSKEDHMAIDERASVCTFDCPDTCSLTVSVDEGRIVKVRGSAGVPYTAGVICNKVARDMGNFIHGPRRLLHYR